MLIIRLANSNDSKDIWRWRNDPITRSVSKNTEAVSFQDHNKWYREALKNDNRVIYIAEVEEEKVGVLRFDRTNDNAWLISINTNPQSRGKGLGKNLLKQGIEVFTKEHTPKKLTAHILEENIASINIFKYCQFIITSNKNRWITLEYNLQLHQ